MALYYGNSHQSSRGGLLLWASFLLSFTQKIKDSGVQADIFSNCVLENQNFTKKNYSKTGFLGAKIR
jgi:hypothetical protein